MGPSHKKLQHANGNSNCIFERICILRVHWVCIIIKTAFALVGVDFSTCQACSRICHYSGEGGQENSGCRGYPRKLKAYYWWRRKGKWFEKVFVWISPFYTVTFLGSRNDTISVIFHFCLDYLLKIPWKNNVYDIKTGASRFLMSFGKKIRFVSHWFLRLKKHSQSNWVSPRLQTALVGLKAICKIQDPRQTPWTELRRWKMRTWTWKVKRKLLRMSSVKSLLNSKTWRFLKLPLMI